jgi:two-component system, LuxR family, sensor kinase FixL
VIVNLVHNAIEAMALRVVRELTITSAPDGEGLIEVSIADTGSGLAPGVAAALFTPFVSTKANGMGVGLSICRSIVEAHGGRMWANGRTGGGTAFYFTVPAALSETDDAAPPLQPAADGGQSRNGPFL